MKKAKIMLSVVALFGIVGGALAYKALGTTTIFPEVNGSCKVAGVVYTETSIAQPTITYNTTSATTCPFTATSLTLDSE